MLNTEKKKCVGCSLCAFSCPQKCISMKENHEHFLMPIVDKSKCINCNICNIVCPVYNKKVEKDEKHCFLAQLISTSQLKKCASGGAFYGIAKYIIENGGIVFGVGKESTSSLKYMKIKNITDLENITGSKYFQCNILPTNYEDIKRELKNNIVLVSGTPCQISAIKNMLGINYSNLITVEILCQGVPNNYVVKRFFEQNEKKNKKLIVCHDFRSKDKYISRNYLNKYVYDDGSIEYLNGADDELCLSFQRNLFLRNSCYECAYANNERISDFTIGDYWEKPQNTNMKIENGVSVILCNNQRAFNYLNKINLFYLEEIDYKKALKNNIPFHRSVKKPLIRNITFKLLNLGISPVFITKIFSIKHGIKKYLNERKSDSND